MNHIASSFAFWAGCSLKFQRFAISLVCFLWVLLSTSTIILADEPRWILNHGHGVKAFSIGQGNLESSLGLVHIRPMGTDLTMSVTLKTEQYFDAATHPFFGLRYKIKSSIPQGGLFYTTDSLTAMSGESYSRFSVIGDGAWHNITVDLRTYPKKNWKGTITSFRLDPINPSNLASEIEISRMGFFANQKQATEFLNQANDEPDYSLEAVIATKDLRCIIPGNTLKRGDVPQAFLLDKQWTMEETAQKLQSGLLPEQLVVAVDDGKTREIVPLSVVTRRGYAVYEARKKGKYILTTNDKASQFTDLGGVPGRRAIAFVVTRGFMTGNGNRFEPDRSCTPAEIEAILTAVKNASCDPTGLRLFFTSNPTRSQVARWITALVQKRLGQPAQSPFDPKYFTRDRIRFGASFSIRSDIYNESMLRDYADCGFDWILASSVVCSDRYRGPLLSICNQFGIELFVNDGNHVRTETARLEYFDQPYFAGHIVIDEPGSDSFDKLATICNAYQKQTGGKIPLVNLLPMYANAAQLKYGAEAAAIEYYDPDPARYKKYCDMFCEKFDTPYICTDIYPFNWVKGKKVTYKDYAESINIIATSAREHNKEFWCYIQTFAWIPSKRTPTEEEFRWQCYSMLSFGCKGLLCWTYAGYKEEFPSLIDTHGHKTPAWYAIRPVVSEIKRLSDVYVQYRNLGAFAHQYSDRVPYLRISTPYTAFKTIEKIDCPQPLLIGCFEKKSAPGTAFTLVNMAEFEDGLGTTAVLKLSGTKVTAYYRGLPEEVVADANGLYRFHLACGEGVFVTVE